MQDENNFPKIIASGFGSGAVKRASALRLSLPHLSEKQKSAFSIPKISISYLSRRECNAGTSILFKEIAGIYLRF